ncbi:MAG: hypothetical protein AB7N70_09055 [Dehalococcoidia bacterium]
MLRRIRSALATSVVTAAVVACGQTDTVILDISGQPDTLRVSGSVDTTAVTLADTSLGPPDTTVVVLTDTVYAPIDTVFIPVVDTVINGTDTTFIDRVDTLVTIDTIVIVEVDTIVTVDTVVVVDTVSVSTRLVASLSTLSLAVGQTASLAVVAENPLGFPTIPPNVTWLSGNPLIASVTGAGVVRGVATGQTDVFALAAGLSVNVPTTVTPAAGPPPPPPPPPASSGDIYIHIDWSTATGSSMAAILDQSKARPFNYTEGFAATNGSSCPSLTVFSTASAGRDYPTTNFIRMRAFDACPGSGSTDGWSQIGFLASSGYVPPLAVGDSVFIRYYVRAPYPYQSIDNLTHGDEWKDWPMPYGVGYEFSASAWQMDVHGLSDGKYCIGGYQQYLLNKSSTYRIEHGVIRTGASTYTIRARVYSATGSLLYDSNNFTRQCWDGTASATLASGSASWSGSTTTWDTHARQFHLGLNGISNLTTSNDEQDVFEWAGFAVCSSWCGPYPIAGIEN